MMRIPAKLLLKKLAELPDPLTYPNSQIVIPFFEAFSYPKDPEDIALAAERFELILAKDERENDWLIVNIKTI